MNVPVILPLNAEVANLNDVGGKGMRLNQLYRAQFPVPPGFVITSAAYHQFIHDNYLERPILELVRSIDVTNFTELLSAEADIQRLFQTGRMRPNVTEAVLEARHMMGLGLRLAVRSSSTNEDRIDATFAGQHRSLLNVCRDDQLLKAVPCCWASLWTASAIAYQRHRGIEPRDVSLPVVVQELVDAQSSGVLFTLNPQTGADELLINAAWGLGHAIVGGRVTPDTVVVNKVDGSVKRQIIGYKSVMTVLADEGTVDIPVEAARREILAITPEHISSLTQLARSVEKYFGGPQNIEWCSFAKQIYLLQSRPLIGSNT
jgi:pyruvate,water dikinase